MTPTEKVLVGLAVVYTAVVVGSRTTAVAAVGAHEAMHAYWEGTGRAEFRGNLTDAKLTGWAETGTRPEIPHIIPRAVGWLVAGALLLPIVWAGKKVAGR